MSASASMAAAGPASGGIAQAIAALSGGRGMDTAQAQLPVDFASLLAGQQSGDAMAQVLDELTTLAKSGEDEEGIKAADISALLSEISQPLPPTEIPLFPVAQPHAAALMTGTAAEQDAGPSASALPLPGNAPTRTELPVGAEAGKSVGESAVGALPEFILPETTQHGMAHANAHAVQNHTTHNTPAPVQLNAQQPVHSSGWSDDVGNNLVWMAKNDIQSAQLSVNPPNLGPIEITLTLNKDQATAHFVSAHAEVREVLEQALPRLKEILEGAGVQLGQADVGAQSQQQQFAQNARQQRQEDRIFGLEQPTLHENDAVNVGNVVRLRTGNGLVDTFV